MWMAVSVAVYAYACIYLIYLNILAVYTLWNLRRFTTCRNTYCRRINFCFQVQRQSGFNNVQVGLVAEPDGSIHSMEASRQVILSLSFC